MVEVTNSEPIADGTECAEVDLAFPRQGPGQPSGVASMVHEADETDRS